MSRRPLKNWQRRQKEPMANPEHLEQLTRGEKAWNQWRKEHPDVRPDLSEIAASPYGVDIFLDGYDLRDILLAGADLAGVTFSRTQLQRADLSDANLHSARFWKANLAGACLRNAVIQFAVFASVRLKGADLTGVEMPSRIVCKGFR